MIFPRSLPVLAAAFAAASFLSAPPSAHAGAFVHGVWDPSAVPEASILRLQWGPRDTKPGSPDRILGQVASDSLRTVEILLREPSRPGAPAADPVLSLSVPVSFLGLSRTPACTGCTNQWNQPDTILASRAYQPGKGCLFDATFRPPGKFSRLEVADVRHEGRAV